MKKISFILATIGTVFYLQQSSASQDHDLFEQEETVMNVLYNTQKSEYEINQAILKFFLLKEEIEKGKHKNSSFRSLSVTLNGNLEQLFNAKNPKQRETGTRIAILSQMLKNKGKFIFDSNEKELEDSIKLVDVVAGLSQGKFNTSLFIFFKPFAYDKTIDQEDRLVAAKILMSLPHKTSKEEGIRAALNNYLIRTSAHKGVIYSSHFTAAIDSFKDPKFDSEFEFKRDKSPLVQTLLEFIKNPILGILDRIELIRILHAYDDFLITKSLTHTIASIAWGSKENGHKSKMIARFLFETILPGENKWEKKYSGKFYHNFLLNIVNHGATADDQGLTTNYHLGAIEELLEAWQDLIKKDPDHNDPDTQDLERLPNLLSLIATNVKETISDRNQAAFLLKTVDEHLKDKKTTYSQQAYDAIKKSSSES